MSIDTEYYLKKTAHFQTQKHLLKFIFNRDKVHKEQFFFSIAWNYHMFSKIKILQKMRFGWRTLKILNQRFSKFLESWKIHVFIFFNCMKLSHVFKNKNTSKNAFWMGTFENIKPLIWKIFGIFQKVIKFMFFIFHLHVIYHMFSKIKIHQKSGL